MTFNITVPTGYRAQSEDKTPESDAAYFYFLRQKPIAQRIEITRALIRMSRRLAISAVMRQYPSQTESGQRLLITKALLQERYTGAFVPQGNLMDWETQDSIGLTHRLHSLLEQLGIRYHLGGGLAAAIWGEPRVTTDAYLILSLQTEEKQRQIDRLIEELESLGFYCPPGAVEGVKSGVEKTISVTHTQTVDNADLIVVADEPFEQSQMRRRVLIDHLGEPFWVCTAEDIILQKLVWSRNSRSEKQWRQVLGVLKVQSDHLDFEYLNQWAVILKVEVRLREAYEAAGV